MTRSYFLDLARSGRACPMATDLVLNEEPDPEAARRDGDAAGPGRGTARAALGLAAWPCRSWTCGSRRPTCWPAWESARKRRTGSTSPRPLDHGDAGGAAGGEAPAVPEARHATGPCGTSRDRPTSCPIGMTIGPFSLATKLMADPITAAALLGSGVTPEDDPQVKLLCDCLEAAEATVLESVRRQLEQGARAVLVCEPAASIGLSLASPDQGRLADLRAAGARAQRAARVRSSGTPRRDLIFHDCGELTARDGPGVRRPARAGRPEPGQLAKALGRRGAGPAIRSCSTATCPRSRSTPTPTCRWRKCAGDRVSWFRPCAAAATPTSWAPSATCSMSREPARRSGGRSRRWRMRREHGDPQETHPSELVAVEVGKEGSLEPSRITLWQGPAHHRRRLGHRVPEARASGGAVAGPLEPDAAGRR